MERDKFLTEARGKCWHVPVTRDTSGPYREYGCSKCGKLRSISIYYTDVHKAERLINGSLSTWKDFGELWEWSSSQPWFEDFWVYIKDRSNMRKRWYIHPDKFADALYTYLKDIK